MVRGLRPYCLRSEGESGVLVGVCETLRCNARGSRLAVPKLNCPVETGRPHEAEPGCVQILPSRPPDHAQVPAGVTRSSVISAPPVRGVHRYTPSSLPTHTPYASPTNPPW